MFNFMSEGLINLFVSSLVKLKNYFDNFWYLLCDVEISKNTFFRESRNLLVFTHNKIKIFILIDNFIKNLKYLIFISEILPKQKLKLILS